MGSFSCVRCHGESASEVKANSDARQACLLSPFLSNFIIRLQIDVDVIVSIVSRIDLSPSNRSAVVLSGEDCDAGYVEYTSEHV